MEGKLYPGAMWLEKGVTSLASQGFTREDILAMVNQTMDEITKATAAKLYGRDNA